MTARALALFVLTLVPSVVRADVIPEDYVAPSCAPLTCPAGSIAGGAGHGCPSACVPWGQVCTTSAECGGPGWACTPTRLCLDMRPAGRMIMDVALAVCAADGSCAEGTCNESSRCMPIPGYVEPPAPSAAPSDGGSSMCSAGHGGQPLVALFGLALFFALRKR